jgi:hypothetical protein
MIEELFSVSLFIHILTIVGMGAPLYNLIVVNERAKMGKVKADVDRYMEKIISTNSIRCYVFQFTALITGLSLLYLHDPPISFFEIWILAKFLLLLALVVSLSFVHFRIQPKISNLLKQVEGDSIPEDISGKIRPLRALRKKLASVCLFLVGTVILIAIGRETPIIIYLLIPIVAIFSWLVYKRGAPLGWI